MKKERILSLDIFRGIAVIGMLFADAPGTWSSMYPIFQHAHWEGCTLTDMIFPAFLFIVGIAITISLRKVRENGTLKSYLPRLLKRVLVLIILGLINTGLYEDTLLDFSSMRVMGVLQRIAIVYLIASILFIKCSYRQLIYISGSVLIVYWIIMSFIPVPGAGMPDLTKYPDGVANNMATWIDKVLLGDNAWKWTKPWDPEGALSTIPSVITTLLGVLTGYLLISDRSKEQKVLSMFVAATFLLLSGTIFGYLFPIIKKIWTSSYVLYTAGWSLIAFALLYWIVDIKGYSKWGLPFKFVGMNAILAFVMSGALDAILFRIKISSNGSQISIKDFLFSNYFDSWMSTINASMVYSLVNVLIWLFVTYVLYKRKIFLKA